MPKNQSSNNGPEDSQKSHNRHNKHNKQNSQESHKEQANPTDPNKSSNQYKENVRDKHAENEQENKQVKPEKNDKHLNMNKQRQQLKMKKKKLVELFQKYNPYILAGLIPLSLIAVFVYAPQERVMGNVQRIFYYHVGSAWVGFFAFFIVFAASIQYLRTEDKYWSMLARASAEIGVIFTTFVLLSGMLWARPTWNTWWTWDPRLTTSLVLWLMYLAYLFLSQTLKGEEKSSQSRLAAIFGIIAFVNVPLVFMSIRWWRTIHPVVIEIGGTGLSPRMIQVLIFSLITISLLYYQLLLMRLKQLNNEIRVKHLVNRLRRRR